MIVGLHVVLYQPQIPANTGNIARTCLATDTTLHLIHPLGFETSDKMLRRAGLDYWPNVKVNEYDSLEELYMTHENAQFYYIENVGTKYYTDVNYTEIKKELFFVFGRETTGLPKKLIESQEEYCLRVHMGPKVRSLNLANTATIVIYEALRQQGFPQMK